MVSATLTPIYRVGPNSPHAQAVSNHARKIELVGVAQLLPYAGLLPFGYAVPTYQPELSPKEIGDNSSEQPMCRTEMMQRKYVARSNVRDWQIT